MFLILKLCTAYFHDTFTSRGDRPIPKRPKIYGKTLPLLTHRLILVADSALVSSRYALVTWIWAVRTSPHLRWHTTWPRWRRTLASLGLASTTISRCSSWSEAPQNPAMWRHCVCRPSRCEQTHSWVSDPLLWAGEPPTTVSYLIRDITTLQILWDKVSSYKSSDEPAIILWAPESMLSALHIRRKICLLTGALQEFAAIFKFWF